MSYTIKGVKTFRGREGQGFNATLCRDGKPVAHVDDAACGGCYNWRTQRMAAHKRSRHSWGIAIDINVADNPFMGTPQMPPAIVLAFKSAGFAWGGDFIHRPDGMHFEFADPARIVEPIA